LEIDSFSIHQTKVDDGLDLDNNPVDSNGDQYAVFEVLDKDEAGLICINLISRVVLRKH